MKAFQFLPLALLYHAGGEINGRTKLMKLTFLADQELEDYDVEWYDFIPYDYGPFDQRLYQATEWLEQEGLIEIKKTYTIGGEERYNYVLTSKARKVFEDEFEDPTTDTEGMDKALEIYEVAEEIINEYDMPVSNLLDRVYNEYPEYAKNSVLV